MMDLRRRAPAMLLGLLALVACVPVQAEQSVKSIVIPMIEPERGQRLFVTKGCVLCHAVRGVGGQAAPPLDAPDRATAIDPLGFAARMWTGATAMLELQAMELGYQIELSAVEIADLAGFVGDPDAQAQFTIDDIPEPLRDWMLDIPYWEEEQEWPESLPDDYPEFQDEGEDL
ncbi:MAG: c-type cytochrome [Pseudomonadota bacterium]